MRQAARPAGLLAALLLLAPRAGWGSIGLATRVISISIEGLEPGRSHGVSDFSELEYSLRNPGDTAVEATLTAQLPEAAPEAPFEPIPDLSWIRFGREKMRIASGASASTEILIALPDDPRLHGRHFEAALWARTRAKGMVAAGVRSRLRFSVGPGPKAEPAVVAPAPCELGPEDVWLRRARPGSRIVLKIFNRTSAPLTLEPRAEAWPAGEPAPRGYLPSDAKPDWVALAPGRLRVAGKRSSDLEVRLTERAALKGRRAAFVVRASARGKDACGPLRVFVEFAESGP